MIGSHSEGGEDLWLLNHFDGMGGGVFVDVGAFDGVWWSNTLLLESEGWTGVCVEPHPRSYLSLIANRPGSTCLHAAVSDPRCPGTTGFLLDLNCDANSRIERDGPVGSYGNTYTRIVVPVVSVPWIVENLVPSGAIDVLSVDAEGHDLDILRSALVGGVRPRVVVAETLPDQGDSVERYMRSVGYTVSERIGHNLMLTRGQPSVG